MASDIISSYYISDISHMGGVEQTAKLQNSIFREQFNIELYSIPDCLAGAHRLILGCSGVLFNL